MVAAGNFAALQERFAAPLEFGTAGLRGELGAGPARMNRAVVARAGAGLCAHLHRARARRAAPRLVHRLRRPPSKPRVRRGDGARSPPRPAFACTCSSNPDRRRCSRTPCSRIGAAGGVMVTASHNPPRDNGYKVYWHDGAQIIAPHDQQIAAAMQALPSVLAIPRMPASERRARGLEEPLGAAFERRYLSAVARADRQPMRDAGALCIAYTRAARRGRAARARGAGAGRRARASHGRRAGRPRSRLSHRRVPEPRRKRRDGSRARAGRAHARRSRACERSRRRSPRRRARDRRASSGRSPATRSACCSPTTCSRSRARRSKLLVLTSIVSTPMIAAIARRARRALGAGLTGFKWIGNRAMELERERGMRFVFGFEEALGYTAGTLVRDKDGISSAVLAARLRRAAQGPRPHAPRSARAAVPPPRPVPEHAGLDPPRRQQRAERREALMQQVRTAPPSALAGIARERRARPRDRQRAPARRARASSCRRAMRCCGSSKAATASASVRAAPNPRSRSTSTCASRCGPTKAIETAQTRARATADVLAAGDARAHGVIRAPTTAPGCAARCALRRSDGNSETGGENMAQGRGRQPAPRRDPTPSGRTARALFTPYAALPLTTSTTPAISQSVGPCVGSRRVTATSHAVGRAPERAPP